MQTKTISILLGTILLMASGATAAPWREFADIEHAGECPSLLAQGQSVEALAGLPQEKLDQIYACAKAGPVPNGFMNGRVVFADGGNFAHFASFASKLLIPINKEKFKKFAEVLWKGKHFYKEERALLNKIGPNVEPVIGVDIKGQMRFPAKVFCGQSLLDSRRESIVIDYTFTDTVVIDGKKPYSDAIDWIAGGDTKTGKRGLLVRDEIRMIKPGLYLGRAYMDRAFVLNFILSGNPAEGQDTCFPGYAPKT